MESLKNFIVDNWQFISSAFLALLSILAIVLKKKPINKFVDDFYGELVSLIQAAELTFGSGLGKDKKKFVLGTFMARHPDYDVYQVSDAIEDILTTPEKKDELKGALFAEAMEATHDFVKGAKNRDGKK